MAPPSFFVLIFGDKDTPELQVEPLSKHFTENAPENARVVMMSCNPGNLHTESRLQAYKDVFL